MAAGAKQPPEDAAGGNLQDRRRARLEALIIGASAAMAVGIAIVGMWAASQSTVRDIYRSHLIQLAVTAAQQVDPVLHQDIRRPEQLDSPDYRRAVEPLRRMRLAIPDIRYIYTLVRDGPAIRFILDSADPGDSDGDGLEDRSAVWDVSYNKTAAIQVALGREGAPGMSDATRQPYKDPWGTFMTGYAPLYDAAGRQIGALGVDVDAGKYVARMIAARNQTLLGLLPAVLLVGILTYGVYRMRCRGLEDARAVSNAALKAGQDSEVLALERERLRNVIEGTNVGTWEWDIRTGEVLINHHWASMLGYRPDDLAPVTVDAWQKLLHPDDLEPVMESLQASFSGHASVYEIDFRMRHRQGHWVWISARGKVIERDAGRNPLRMVGTHQDITSRKTIMLALEESEGKFRGLFELSPVGIALNDLASGRFIETNEAMRTPTGYSGDEFLNLSIHDITPSGREGQRPGFLEVLATTGRYGPNEAELRRKDGSRYPVLVSGMRMVDSSGRAVIWSLVQDISQRKAMERELTEAARCDKLTGLANRTLLMSRLKGAIDRVRAGLQPRFAVLFLDFDHFKLLNDTLGHEAGDELLRGIAQRLQSTLRAADAMSEDETGNLVARFGGDEFVILINDLHARADAARIAERLLNSLAPSYSIGGRDVHSTASVGIVTSDQCMDSAEEVIRNADVAMYEAKRMGRACSVIFNESMHARLTRHVTIESGLRKAMGTPQLSLVYQPIVDLESGRIVSAEALMRWDHPQLGPISPAEFIPIAEESGLIVPLGEWVLQEACKALAHWRRQSPGQAPPAVSINVSRAELALGQRLLRRIRDNLAKFDLPAESLQLEVTEREVMRDPDLAHDLMHELRGIGVKLAMDDFGTGTSSLGCLRDYPFDCIKIDRSFVSDLEASKDVMAVIHATITLVENLGMASVAEGVESAEQVAILQSLGCRYAQGYYFSRPVSKEALTESMGSLEETNLFPAA